MSERQEVQCKWVGKLDNTLQLQASMWWVGSVSESEHREGLFYWKVVIKPFSLKGYSTSEREAIDTVEALIKTCENYKYILK